MSPCAVSSTGMSSDPELLDWKMMSLEGLFGDADPPTQLELSRAGEGSSAVVIGDIGPEDHGVRSLEPSRAVGRL